MICDVTICDGDIPGTTFTSIWTWMLAISGLWVGSAWSNNDVKREAGFSSIWEVFGKYEGGFRHSLHFAWLSLAFVLLRAGCMIILGCYVTLTTNTAFLFCIVEDCVLSMT